MKTERSAIESIFAPNFVAVIGATEIPGSVGRALAENLRSFKGRLHFINPNSRRVLDLPTCASIREVGEPVDLPQLAVVGGTGS